MAGLGARIARKRARNRRRGVALHSKRSMRKRMHQRQGV